MDKHNEVTKGLLRIIIPHTAMLIFILILVIAITGIPQNFNISSFNGVTTLNMPLSAINDSIINNFKIIFTGEAFSTVIQGETTLELLIRTGKKSSLILFLGTVLALLVGIPKGIIDSRKKNTSGTLKLLQSLIPLSLPDVFTIGLLQFFAMYLFTNSIRVFGINPLPYIGDETILHSIYPIVAISILPSAYISRITASTIEEGYGKPYILAARGKGLSRLQIIKSHLLKSIFFNILSGFTTIMGIMFSSLIIIERLFSFRGVGFYLLYFYTSQLIEPYEAGIGFTLFIVALSIIYYLILVLIKILKDTVIQIKEAG